MYTVCRAAACGMGTISSDCQRPCGWNYSVILCAIYSTYKEKNPKKRLYVWKKKVESRERIRINQVARTEMAKKSHLCKKKILIKSKKNFNSLPSPAAIQLPSVRLRQKLGEARSRGIVNDFQSISTQRFSFIIFLLRFL